MRRWKTLKAELVDNVEYATHSEARRDVFAFMEVWYNRQRLHSALDYTTPEQMELTAALSPLNRCPHKSGKSRIGGELDRHPATVAQPDHSAQRSTA
ncbi:integrase core domain-containing protein [Belnapia arida]|uniref:integrase core domain-containing protein n=1 Tax=Belnapia arida TaxID=2804533 RepID=UPI0038B3FB51